MASKSKTEKPRSGSRRSVAPKVLLLALVAVSAWGLWRVWWSSGAGPDGNAVGAPAAATAPTSSPLTPSAKVAPAPAPASNPAPVLVPTTPRQTGVPDLTGVATPPPSSAATASNRVPTLSVPPMTAPTSAITSAPVLLSTQVFRAALATPEPVASNSIPISGGLSDATSPWIPRGATNYLEAQIALAGLGISSGSIDGVGGAQTAAALKAFQMQQGLEQTGWLDRNTRKALVLKRTPFASYRVVADDLLRLAPVPETWVGKSQVPGLEHETLLERLAERFQSHPNWLRRLNPAVDWERPIDGLELTVPALPTVSARRAGLIRISLSGRFLRVFDTGGQLIAHFPCSIARRVEKRPVGDLQVVVTVPNPDYTWDPEVFPESPESRTVGRKLRIPPGPNNPVGVAWIGLNRSGYGIHGTPKPEDVGRTESHGCFRLANWNAELLRRMAWPGLPVRVEGEAPTPSAPVNPVASTNAEPRALTTSSTSKTPAGVEAPTITNAPPTKSPEDL